MTGQLKIDGADAYSTYGVFLTGDSYAQALTWASLKELLISDWPDQNGIDVDLSAPVLDTRNLTLSFYSDGLANIGGLMSALTNGSYHTFEFVELGISHSLRLVSQPSYRNYSNATKYFSLQLADDFPLEGYNYLAPVPTGISATGFKIDNVDLANYGMIVSEESEAEILKSPAIKQNLLVSLKSKSGVSYDSEEVYVKSKEVEIGLFFRGSMSDYIRNSKALLYNLTKPGERALYAATTGESYGCYYNGHRVEKFLILNNKVWCEFSVSLVFTNKTV
ncbi:MAG: hypothetical protein LLF93_03225 [Bacteroidales bacterium]|nr:hypothetical protein [Bacteroidales bacterium]